MMIKCGSVDIYLYILIILFVFPFGALGDTKNRNPSQLNYECYLSNKFPIQMRNRKYIFDAFEKIYLYVKFLNINNGKYQINVNWLKASGEVERSSSSEIKIDYASDYTYYSWFKLLKKGMFSKMIEGNEYDFDQKGNREVVVDVNGIKICSISFEIK